MELRRRIIIPRDRRRETWDDWDGLDSRGDLARRGLATGRAGNQSPDSGAVGLHRVSATGRAAHRPADLRAGRRKGGHVGYRRPHAAALGSGVLAGVRGAHQGGGRSC